MRTWELAWDSFSKKSGMGERAGQMQMGREVFANVKSGGQLVVQAPTGTGKSLAYLLPLVARAVHEGERSVVSTETLTLLDQLVDKDLPMLQSIYPNFTFFGLKGRNHYLCHAKAGRAHPITGRLASLDIGNGERRDVERILGRELDDDDWREVSSESEHCSANQCDAKDCYSTRAREKALKSQIVVTSHAMLRVHGDQLAQDAQGMSDGVLGDVKHIVIDEAHTLEQVFVSGGTVSLTPWELNQKIEAISKGSSSVPFARVEGAERQLRSAVDSIVRFMDQTKGAPHIDKWTRESMRLSQFWINKTSPPALLSALEAYEEGGARSLAAASKEYESIGQALAREAAAMDRGKRKVRTASNAAGYLASLSGLIGMSMQTRDGTVDAWGSTYVMLADGWKAKSGRFGTEAKGVRLRSVPLDISGFCAGLWNSAKSVTLVSATLADPLDGGFKYVRRSLGLGRSRGEDSPPWQVAELTVASPFDYARQQMVYLTPGTGGPVDVPGARYGASELRELLHASDGRALVLFTSRAELDDASRRLRMDESFPWELLVQEEGVRKEHLVNRFMANPKSVLLATKSFFTGVNFAGEACSLVAICKWPNPQYNDLTKAQMAYWRERGFPRWYESVGLQVFAQASGRLIRDSADRGVVALLDNRVAEQDSNIMRVVRDSLPVLYDGSHVTNQLSDVQSFFAAQGAGAPAPATVG